MMENEDIVRQQKILGILRQEIEDGADLAAESKKIIGYLLREKKGYAPEDVQADVIFEVKTDREAAHSSVDFLISVGGRKAMIVKCCAGSLSSRERQAVAAARIIAAPPVPVAVVADPENAEVLDVVTGKVTGEGFGAIPVKDQLLQILSGTEAKPLTPERIEREKRVLLAFDAIRCSVPQGADGGVKLDNAGE